jgi:fatty-acyl-CoA synthase
MVRNDEDPTVIEVDSGALSGDTAAHQEAQPIAVVSTGRPLQGVEVEVAAARGEVGEIFVRSPSLAEGYVNDPTLTAQRFVDGRVCTGDLGVLDEAGELYVIGRVDDMISVAGRKIYARDLEQALDAEAGVRPGASVLVDTAAGGRQRLVVLAEPAKGVTDFAPIAKRISDIARTRLGVRIDDCLIVPGGTLPKTPSGKIQRHRCRELVTTGELPIMAQLT